MTKQELRKVYQQKRELLSETEINEKSALLCHHFFTSIELSAVNYFHCFLPISRNKEPDTWKIIRRIRQEFSTIKIVIPKVNNQNGQLESFLLDEESLKTNSWGIPEPVNGTAIDSLLIDLILVPLLAVDKTGHRIGYGKGHYDHFFATCRNDSKKVGISFFEPIDKIEELFEHDFPLNGCITPIGYIDYGSKKLST